MPIFDVTFRTECSFAQHFIDATTHAAALEKARAMIADAPGDLGLEPYDPTASVNEIDICGDGDTLEWMAADQRTRCWAAELLDMLKQARTALNTIRSFYVRPLDCQSDHLLAKIAALIIRAETETVFVAAPHNGASLDAKAEPLD